MKAQIIFLNFLMLGILFIAACDNNDDDKDNTEDWATAVAGTYNGTLNYSTGPGLHGATTTISRVSDNLISLQLSSSSNAYCLDSVSLSSSISFTINEFDVCRSETETGAGSFGVNSISYEINGNSGVTVNVTGTK